MKEKNEKNNKSVMRYRQLSPLLKTTIQILAVQVYELRIKNIILYLSAMGFSDKNNGHFVPATIRPFLKELESQHLIIKNSRGITCCDSIWLEAVQDAVLTNQFKKIVSAIMKVTPLQFIHKKFYFKRIEEFYRAVQLAVYAGERYADLDGVYSAGCSRFPMEIQENPPFLKLFNHPFNPRIFHRFTSDIRLKILEYMLTEAEKTLEPVGDMLDYCVHLLSEMPDQIEEEKNIREFKEIYKVMDFLLLSGRINEHTKLLRKFKDPLFCSAQLGCAQMLCNKNDMALISFKNALNFLKKKTRRRKIFFQGHEGVFFLFALLKSKKSEDHRAALTYIDSALKDETPYSPVINAMKPLFQEKLGLAFIMQDSLAFSIKQAHALISFFNILVMTWMDKKKAGHYIFLLENIREKTIAAGLLWMEAEISAILDCLGHDAQKNSTSAKSIHTKCGTTSLIPIVKPIPKWEKTLKSLMNIGEHINPKSKSDKGAKAAISKKRLIWLLHYNDKYNTCYIIPRIQTMSKNGTWTKGRAVALKNLYHNYYTMEGLTDQDKQVCSTMVEEAFRTGYGYYTTLEYRFDYDRALPLLVGHPLIFLEDSLTNSAMPVPVELVMGEPELRLRINKKKINILMHPTLRNIEEKSLLMVRETPSRFKLIQFSSDHKKIAGLLGKDGLSLPANAKKMAGKAIESLASIVNVNSDLALAKSGHVKKIKSDHIPHVHVMPWQEGIKIEFLIRPFVNTGSYFKPGHGGSNVFAEIKGKKVQALRDLAMEKKLTKAVIDACPTLNHLEEVEGQWLVGDSEDALELLFELKNCAANNKTILEWPQGEKMKVRREVSFNDFKLSLKKDREWFKATGTLNIDKNLTLDLTKLMELLDKPRSRFITMDDGTFIALTRSLKERLEELKAYSTPHAKGLRFPPLTAPAIEDLTDQVGSLKTDKAWKEHCRKLKEIVKPEIPGTLQASLRDYQEAGFKWLAQLVHWNVGACLADDMGLGKTVQALAAILLNAGEGPTLVVAPLSVMANWQDECSKFAPTLNPLVFGQGNRQKFLDDLRPFDLVISSYGLLQVEAKKLAGVDWQTIVLDEAQAIKNMKTKRSKAAMKLNSQFRMITTGTPVENHLDELWTLFNFLNPGLLGTFNHFKNAFAVPIERDQDKDASRRLRKLISPFILRRLKINVLKELPAKTEITLKVEMSREEAALYEAQRIKAIANIENADDQPGQKHLRILGELMKLRQICCNPALILPGAGIESSKLKVFGDIVADLLENRHKALVFSQFVGHLSILRKFLDSKNITYQYLDGATPAKKRQEKIKAFQSGIGDLFLISLKAGGFGLNLTAADYVIHMDPWWNPAVEDQASDRAHRIGQSRPVTVYRLVVKDSIEEKIITLHKEKRDLAESLLSGSDMAGKVSAQELLKLLHGK